LLVAHRGSTVIDSRLYISYLLKENKVSDAISKIKWEKKYSVTIMT